MVIIMILNHEEWYTGTAFHSNWVTAKWFWNPCLPTILIPYMPNSPSLNPKASGTTLAPFKWEGWGIK